MASAITNRLIAAMYAAASGDREALALTEYVREHGLEVTPESIARAQRNLKGGAVLICPAPQLDLERLQGTQKTMPAAYNIHRHAIVFCTDRDVREKFLGLTGLVAAHYARQGSKIKRSREAREHELIRRAPMTATFQKRILELILGKPMPANKEAAANVPIAEFMGQMANSMLDPLSIFEESCRLILAGDLSELVALAE